MIRALPYVLLVAIGGLSVFYVMNLRATNASLTADLGAAQRELGVAAYVSQQRAEARDVAQAHAARHAANAAKLTTDFTTFKKETENAPSCPDTLRFIDGLLRK